MVGHLIHDRFSDGDRPTSLSRRAITTELREGLGFTGLVVTDDLGMDAITRRYKPEDAAVMAVAGGGGHADLRQPVVVRPAGDRPRGSVDRRRRGGRAHPRTADHGKHARSHAVREALGQRTAATPDAPPARDCDDQDTTPPAGADSGRRVLH